MSPNDSELRPRAHESRGALRDLEFELEGVDPPDRGFTLTKAELAEMLFERVGLNKRESKDMVETFFDEILRHSSEVTVSSFQVSAISSCATSRNGQAVIPRQAKPSRFRLAEWSPFMRARSSKP